MSIRSRIIDSFRPAGPERDLSPLLLLDLTLWHRWHRERSTLPDGWTRVTDAAKALGAAVWAPFKPWRVAYEGVQVAEEETDGQRDIIYRVGGSTLLARWTLGPDGDWWQTDYPVKTPEDLLAAVEVAAARRYVVDSSGLEAWRAAVGDDGVVPLELPMRPYSDILHGMVGWSQGLTLLLGEGKPLVARIVASLEAALARVAEELAGMDGDLLLAPDNLDGQYLSPRTFKEYLAPSYAATAELGRRCGKPLVVHVGGAPRRLVPLLAQAGVDGIEGISGPPHGDSTLGEAREAGGPGVTLWGGIPQDMLLDAHEEDELKAAVSQALEQARADSARRSVIGIADRVPVDAELGRLQRLVEMVR